jgi:Protein of unknown function (DUF1203)
MPMSVNRNINRVGPYLVVAPILMIIVGFYGRMLPGSGTLGIVARQACLFLESAREFLMAGRRKRVVSDPDGPYFRRNTTRRCIMRFRIRGLPAEEFKHLFTMADEELARHGAVRLTADSRDPGYPCRVSLTDSKPGDELILVNYEHLPVDSPYRMRFAIFVREGDETYDKVDEIPAQLRSRTLAVRAFDRKGMMTGFQLAEGSELEAAIEKQFRTPGADYLHVHFAAPGCYAARIDRA